ncbi:COG3904 family protein [Neoroseomonas soli]|uniref:Uncharacterized protein n=1 Tax=Neoroseomonas soli TaxID=1081025 RepID=A0A9X9WVI2_9PROT|nr:hypothetical protein [Neoroseomonas soli]MBR0671161.1 hypothetical protein [Neoroseomonas soli]
MGRITSETPADFRRFVSDNPQNYSGVTVYLHSPGGSLTGGMELGRQFRANAVNTVVGHVVRLTDPNGAPFAFAQGAECMSACVFAFAGGVRRYYDPVGGVPPRSPQWVVSDYSRQILGVHQFYRSPGTPGSSAGRGGPQRDADTYDRGLSDAQQISGRLVEYLAVMGVHARLLDLAARTSPDTVRALTRAEAFGIGLANDPASAPPWTMTPSAGGLALRTRIIVNQTAVVAEIACDHRNPAGLRARLLINSDLRYLARGGTAADVNRVLASNYGGAIWSEPYPAPRPQRWPAQTRGFRWNGSQVEVEVSLPAPVARALAAGEKMDLSFELPGFISRSLPHIELAAPELAEAQQLLLRNCPSQ